MQVIENSIQSWIMQFRNVQWDGLFTVIPCSTNMVSICMSFWSIFIVFYFSFLYFEGISNKAIFPLVLVGHAMIIGNLVLHAFLGSFVMQNTRLQHNRTPPHKPIVFIVFLILLSFCFVMFYINCVFYTKQEPILGYLLNINFQCTLQSLKF